MEKVVPALIRKSRLEVISERVALKQRLKSELSEHGDIAHIFRLMNSEAPISYTTVVQTLNPNLTTWSPRVIEFAERYVATKKSLQAAQSQA